MKVPGVFILLTPHMKMSHGAHDDAANSRTCLHVNEPQLDPDYRGETVRSGGGEVISRQQPQLFED